MPVSHMTRSTLSLTTIRPVLLLFVLSAGLVYGRSPRMYQFGPTGLVGSVSKTSMTVKRVDKDSPADGKIVPGDIIIGAGDKTFKQNPRRELAEGINLAETKAGAGKLTVMLKGRDSVDLQLTVLGSYSDTAPYNCPKSEAIITRAAEALIKSGRIADGACKTGLLGLMATGEKKYIDVVKEVLPKEKWVYPNPDDIDAVVRGDKDMGYVGWYWGYNCIALGEYYLLTGDKSVLPGLKTYAVGLARGQDAGGLWGHRMATPKRNGRLPGYAQMNQPSLSNFMGMLMARKCGIKDPDLDTGIEKTYAYYESYVGKGAFPYGVHGPKTHYFNNNGTSGSAAICMALAGNKKGATFFSQLAATSYETLENGHASTFFNSLWTPLGTHISGPDVTRQFFQKTLWFETMYRSWDGNFSRFGGNSKEGPETGVGLLVYCLPRKALIITGRETDTSIWFRGDQATAVVERSQVDYESKSADELLALFGDPIPQVTRAAVWTLRNKKGDFEPKLKKMMKEGSKTEKISALGYYGYKCPAELQLAAMKDMGNILRDKKEDPEIRAAAAGSLCWIGEPAYPYYKDMLQLIVDEEPEDHFRDVDQSVSKSINTLCPDPFAAGLVESNKDLFYQAVRKLANHERQHARDQSMKMLAHMPEEDFPLVAETVMHIIKDQDSGYHSYHTWQGSIGSAINILANLNIKEGIDYTMNILDRDGGKWGFKVRMVCAALPKYGANAKSALEKLKADPRLKNIETSKFRGPWGRMVKAIDEDSNPKKLISLDDLKK